MKLIKRVIVIYLVLFFNGAYALKSDSKQPVYIDSNTASFSDKTQLSIYTGNVITRQGTLYITSDKLVVQLKNGDVEKMVFTGKPAKFKQLPGKDKEYIHGECLIGEYYPKENKLILMEEAIISQGGSHSASRVIIYDSKKSLIKAGDKSSDLKRVHSVFKFKSSKKQTTSPLPLKKIKETAINKVIEVVAKPKPETATNE
ncbi:MAG: lipopolysaccharide transport periplasmic protein LptA [Methylococcales symbiont of Iophon sp. n. MRB-2018]|nr:MAG: lipopolysaccharide transport periplasmic protein LptA [Methylococcales symbiont of Iophon sp. n. MRB-2018]KAF3980174.1 MAG: lipopolysaccharide transport periplasmic protein LptA [Methylococcales symbiont of Iophon sp. n. MRB-2018]